METFPEDPFETVKAVPLPYLFVCFLPFKVFLIIHNKLHFSGISTYTG